MNQLVHPMEQSLSRNPKIPFLYFHVMHLNYMILQPSLYDKCVVCAHFTHVLQAHDSHWIKDYSRYLNIHVYCNNPELSF